MWLPADFHVSYSLEKAFESETHCYTPAQFIAMVELTQSLPELQWFHPVIAIPGLPDEGFRARKSPVERHRRDERAHRHSRRATSPRGKDRGGEDREG
jgi:hypothetical protein